MGREERRQLVGEAAAAQPKEACGLLFGELRTRLFLRLVPTGGARNGPVSFAIDTAEIAGETALRRARGEVLLGCYHSHIRAPARPTRGDRRGGARRGGLWLIYSLAGRDAALFEWTGADFTRRALYFV
ncbi:MAG TPA: Mov34/MPN/PAD-1 family protein [Allosphingosinicella sp.]